MTLLSWDILAFMGITISFLIVTLIFMLSYMFNNEFLKSWSKEEFFNVFITLILFGGIISLVKLPMFSDNVNNANKYVGKLFENVLNIQIGMISDVSALGLISSLSFFVNPTALMAMAKGDSSKEGQGNDAIDSLSASISLSPFFSPFITSLSSLQVYSFVPITMVKLHHLLIEFITKDASRSVPILLAAGIFLRVFKFSRNAGNTLIALFISLYFILPVIYLFNQSVVKNALEIDTSKIKNISDGGFVTKLMNLMTSQIKTASMSGMMSESSEEDIGPGDGIGKDIYNMLLPGTKDSIYTFVVIFFIEGFILPYLAIIIALGIAREFAMSLGSNVDFSSLVRLI